MSDESLYDVVIYERETGMIDALIGVDMRRDSGFFNAEKRAATCRERISTRYAVAIVPAKRYKKGDVLDKNDRE